MDVQGPDPGATLALNAIGKQDTYLLNIHTIDIQILQSFIDRLPFLNLTTRKVIGLSVNL